jgi:hypothetical protein
MRLATGEEALVARVITEARHMAEWAAGVRAERPPYESQLDHAWERSFLSDEEIEWQSEPGFAKMKWLSE